MWVAWAMPAKAIVAPATMVLRENMILLLLSNERIESCK